MVFSLGLLFFALRLDLFLVSINFLYYFEKFLFAIPIILTDACICHFDSFCFYLVRQINPLSPFKDPKSAGANYGCTLTGNWFKPDGTDDSEN